MKKIHWLIFLGLFAFIPTMSGCATPFPVGMIYTELKLPINVGSGAKNEKVGTSECMSALGLVATGDASIETAMKKGGITKINHVDWEVKNILGVNGWKKWKASGADVPLYSIRWKMRRAPRPDHPRFFFTCNARCM